MGTPSPALSGGQAQLAPLAFPLLSLRSDRALSPPLPGSPALSPARPCSCCSQTSWKCPGVPVVALGPSALGISRRRCLRSSCTRGWVSSSSLARPAPCPGSVLIPALPPAGPGTAGLFSLQQGGQCPQVCPGLPTAPWPCWPPSLTHGSFRELLFPWPQEPLPSPRAVGLDCAASPAGCSDALGRLNLVGLSGNTFVWFLCPCASESVDFYSDPANGARVGAEGSAVVGQGLCSSQVVELQMLRKKKPHWPSSGGGIVPLPLGFVWSFLPVHPLLHLTVYICFIVHRFVNIIPLPEVFVHNLGFVALFIQPLSGMFP